MDDLVVPSLQNTDDAGDDLVVPPAYENDNNVNVYSYISFPNVVFNIIINGTTKQFKVSEDDMGNIIKSLKDTCTRTFDDETITGEIIMTDNVINEDDIDDDIKRNTKIIEDTLNTLFEDILKVITKQCHTCGVTHEPRILSHVLNWFKNACNYIQETIMNHYYDLRIMDKTFCYLVNSVFDEKQVMPTDAFIDYMKKRENGSNIIKTRSLQPTKYVKVLYKDKCNNLKIAKAPMKHKYYIINVETNSCSCPDFIYRKLHTGLSCKHLMELKNKTRCLMLLKEIQNENLYNVDMPFKEMLKAAYNTDIKY